MVAGIRIASAVFRAEEALQKMAAVTSGEIRVRLEHLLTRAPVPTDVCTLGLDT